MANVTDTTDIQATTAHLLNTAAQGHRTTNSPMPRETAIIMATTKSKPEPTAPEQAAISALGAVPGSDCEEFACVWMESKQEWMVLFSNGYVLRGEKPWGAIGYANQAAMTLLGRGECAWRVESGNGSYFSYQKEDDHLWEMGKFTPNSKAH